MRDSTPPTPDEISRAISLQEADRAGRPRTEAEAEAVTARIYADWRAAHAEGRVTPDIASFIRDVAAHRSVTNEDRGATRAFWSWKSRPEGAPRVVDHRFLAQACGESRAYQVLEDSPAGRQLDAYRLWEPLVKESLVNDFALDAAEVDGLAPEVWATISGRYAEAAEGPVVAFCADIGAHSILGKDELPRLLAHETVGKENVGFPLPAPRHEHLPPEVDALMANESLRCQVRMEDYDVQTTVPKDFAAKLGALDVPENLREAHASALSRLSSAHTYDELAAPAPPEPAARQQQHQQQQQHVVSARAAAFLPGVTIRPTAAPPSPRGPSTHGVSNPVAAEVAPKAVGIGH
ncbi:hypothetical protein [Streptomyces sp. H27-H5]|uniref:hypothetical protein n=1 Tax=Streptomyces sp. H27-H5 TaxID=2996460 RepID=UPI00226DA2E5|nr:hypothetical protein [Streptomyces sp. H27-H5]MCY0961753.1 hypothetical protein [Streptomyces sp. H27-H5]